MVKKHKPEKLEIGKAYRLYAPFSREAGETVALITHVDEPRWNRQIRYVLLEDDRMTDELGWYRPFLTQVHSEEQMAIQ